MDRIELFRIFARVVEGASFTRAADSLGMPRSSLSMAIRELEARMGTLLLHRTTRRVAPTQDGLMFYERCLRVIAEVEEVEGLFRETASGPSGLLRIDVPSRIGRLVISPALPGFLKSYPGIKISLGVTDRAVDLVRENIDCVVRVGPLSDSGLIGRSIGSLPLINVASPAYLAEKGVPAHPSELGDHRAVHYSSPSTGRVEDWEWTEGGAVKTRALEGNIIVNSAEAYIACCLAGLGLIQIPAYDVKDYLATGALVEVMPAYRAEPMAMTLLYPNRHHLPRRLEVFNEWITSLLKGELLSGR